MRKEGTLVVFSAILIGIISLFPLHSSYTYVKGKDVVVPCCVDSLAYSPSGDFLAVSYGADSNGDFRYESGGVAIISVNSSEIVKTLEGHDDWQIRVAWRPQGDMLATASQDGTVRIWNTSSWETMRIFTVYRNVSLRVDSIALAWSTDGEQFAVSINDKIIFVYSVLGGAALATLMGHDKYVEVLAWSPDGNYIASGSWDESAIVWNAASFEFVKRLGGGSVGAMAWSPDGRYLATASQGSRGKLRIWSSGNWELVSEVHMSFGISLSWSPDGAKLAAGRWECTFLIWDTTVWEVSHSVRAPYGVRVLQWSPKGGEVAVGMINRPGVVSIWREEPV